MTSFTFGRTNPRTTNSDVLGSRSSYDALTQSIASRRCQGLQSPDDRLVRPPELGSLSAKYGSGL